MTRAIQSFVRAHGRAPVRFAALAAFVAVLAIPAPVAAQTIAITNGMIYPVSGPPIEQGAVVIQDGIITAVGANVPIPPDARIINAAGSVVTPGFLDSATRLGLVEVSAVAGTRDAAVDEDEFTAAFNVIYGINPNSTLLPVTRIEGITRAVVAPAAGESIIAGRGVLMDLLGDRVDTMVHKNPVAVFATLGQAGAERAGGARSAAVLRLRQAFEAALDFAANPDAYDPTRHPEISLSRLDLRALVPVVRGEVPLALRVDRASDILVALDLAERYGLDLVLLGAAEGWMVAEEIAAAGVPVVLDPFNNVPQFDELGATLENAARLHAAGVRVAFASFGAHNARTLKQAAGIAVAYGMPYRAALRAVTIAPARIWGVADEYGTLEPGKVADVVVWSGDPFELTTTVQHVIIRGQPVPMTSRQRKLFRRYRDDERLPPAYDTP